MLAFLPEDALAPILAQQSFHGFTPTTHTSADSLRADLAEARARGYALDREEHEPGSICLALPILTQGGRVLGALSITSTTARMTLADLEAVAPTIRATAARIAQDAQTWRFPDDALTRTGT